MVFAVGSNNQTETARQKFYSIAKRYGVEAVAVGNGTASRETTDVVKKAMAELDAGIRVTVDGVSYENGDRITVPRHQSPTLTLRLPAGAVLEKADYNGQDVTQALQGGSYRLPPMESDGLLTVTLRPGTSQPATGDTGAALYVLCASLAAGALLTLGRSRKKHS